MGAEVLVRTMADVTAADARLVARALAGEREAFADLVRRHQEPLYRHARGMGVAPDVAQDLVQDTFVRAYTRLRQCRDPSRFRAWLMGILRHLVLDLGRDLRQRTVAIDALPPDHASLPPPPHELRRALGQALAALPPLLREAFLLRHQQGYSYEEVAAITGARLSATKMRVHRAREQLRQALADVRM